MRDKIKLLLILSRINKERLNQMDIKDIHKLILESYFTILDGLNKTEKKRLDEGLKTLYEIETGRIK